jgi:hypothetical protein
MKAFRDAVEFGWPPAPRKLLMLRWFLAILAGFWRGSRRGFILGLILRDASLRDAPQDEGREHAKSPRGTACPRFALRFAPLK